MTQPSVSGQQWWEMGVFYQIYPRSFADANGDGVGDLDGIRGRLDYLAWLGIDVIWLSPFYKSPMADFGYDVAGHCEVDPLFGSMDDFDLLLAEAHDRGMKVIVDWIPNHTSDQHPWFAESRSDPSNPKRDWYIWREGRPDEPPNNWRAAFRDDIAWTWDEPTRSWYLHLFLPEQPDLNWSNPEVVTAMQDVMRFWLGRGVDGFRADVVHAIGKDPSLPDFPRDGMFHAMLDCDERSQAFIRGFRSLLDSYPSERMMVGEVYILDTARVASYVGDDLLNLSFNFPPMWAPWSAAAWLKQMETTYRHFGASNRWPTWVLSNHDHPRIATRYGSEAEARAAAVLLLTQRGTPFLYAGDELGLSDAVIHQDERLDPGGRDGCRAPIPWDPSPEHGWPAKPWLPWPPQPERHNAASLRAEQGSILHLYRRLLRARRNSPALQAGSLQLRSAPDETLSYLREAGGDRRAIVINFANEDVSVPLDERWRVEAASDSFGEGDRYAGVVRPLAGVLLSPDD